MPIKFALRYYLWRIRKKKSLGLTTVLLALVLSLAGNACTFYFFDGPIHEADGDPLEFSDCLWYSFISISTIGYGDLSAASTGARIGTLVFIVLIGLAAFTTFFGIIVDWFIELHNREVKGMSRIYAKEHILIVNFPSEPRVRQLIEELQEDDRNRNRQIVIVTNDIAELPFSLPNVSFVRGSPVEKETFEQAGIDESREAIVLCTAPDDPHSDSVVASIVSFLEHLRPELVTVAECLSEKHRSLFEATDCDAVVFSNRMVNNLLVHESQDRGVIRLMDLITTSSRGETLYSLDVGDLGSKKILYIDFAKILLDNAINVISVIRDKETFTDFTGKTVETGDRLVYIDKERTSWDRIRKMLN